MSELNYVAAEVSVTDPAAVATSRRLEETFVPTHVLYTASRYEDGHVIASASAFGFIGETRASAQIWVDYGDEPMPEWAPLSPEWFWTAVAAMRSAT